MTEEKTYTEAEAQRHFAAKINGDVWGLLEKADRSKADDEVMVHAAHASCCHWLAVGTGVHHQRGEWMIARVYSELGLAEAALRHARRCQELTEEHADLMEDFDRAYALEGLARAHAVAGDHDQAREYLALAQKAGEAIADEESRKFFTGDLEGGSWYGLQ
jgi:hypothetical protein